MKNKTQVTRRDFLKAATVAVAAESTAEPLARAPAILSSPNPYSVVNYGLIGTGTDGSTLLRFLTKLPTSSLVIVQSP